MKKNKYFFVVLILLLCALFISSTIVLGRILSIRTPIITIGFLTRFLPRNNYNSKKSLLHQIFRRYGLIIQNNLSNNNLSSPKLVIAWNSSATLPPITPLSLTVGIILIPSLLKIFK